MRLTLLLSVVFLWTKAFIPGEALADDNVIRACAHKHTGILRLSPLGTCRPREVPLAWNVHGPVGPPGPALVGSVVFLRSSGAITTVAGGPSVEIPGLAATIPVSEDSMLWVQGDFHEHRFCDGYLDRSHRTESWTLDLEVDGVIVASREMRGEQGNVFNHESKPFTWVSEPLAPGDHSIRFLLRPPLMDTVATPPNQAKICLGTDGTDERQSRVVLFEIPS
jgi:hypothetical protein